MTASPPELTAPPRPPAGAPIPLSSLTWHRPLLVLAALMALTLAVGVAGLLFDPRTLLGAPIWAKAVKFAISILLYAVTLSWLIAQVRRFRRVAWWSGTVAVVFLVIEMVIIVGNIIAGTASHFNVVTPFHALLWSVMAVSIGIVWIATLVVGFTLFRSRLGDAARTLAIRAGVLIGLLGMALAGLMTSPRAEQLAGFRGISGAHAVGVADGGPGLFLLGWSTVAGDLRIPHFVGMHALQLLPLAMILLELAARRIPALRDQGTRWGIVWVLTGLYLGVLAVLTAQALGGESIVRPSAPVIATSVALFGGAGLATALIIARALSRVRASSPAPAVSLDRGSPIGR